MLLNRYRLIPLLVTAFVLSPLLLSAQSSEYGWYSTSSFQPEKRIEFTVTNTLDTPREDAPIAIPREAFPESDYHELSITLVDPNLDPRPEPTLEQLKERGNHLTHAETNGRSIQYQADDLDKDGIWDELFFVTDLEPGETRTFHLYFGFNNYGLFQHSTAAGMGNYVRHMVPYWEAEDVGWKLWYPTNIDVYAKRDPQLMANHMIQNNLDGYTVPHEMGNDIMFVQSTMGGGGIGLFENPSDRSQISRPRFSEVKMRSGDETPYNVGQQSDTRYSFDVLANGPLRSMIKARTFNWNSGEGYYELEQVYTAYARQSFATSEVTYTRFQPMNEETQLGAGFRRHPSEEIFVQEGNLIFTGGEEDIISPGDPDGLNVTPVDFTIHAFAVPEKYNPEFQKVEDYGGNYTFRMDPPEDLTFTYIIGSAWSDGVAFDTEEEFMDYMRNIVAWFDSPVSYDIGPVQMK